MKWDNTFIKSLIEVSHIEFQSYDFHRRQLIFSSGFARRFLGYTEEDFFKHSRNFYEDIIHPDDLKQVEENIDELIHSADGEIVEMTVRYRRADSVYIWVYSRKVVAERDKNGDPSTITTVAEDITEMMRLQDQLKDRIEQLEAISYKNSHLVRSQVASIIGLINLIEEQDITSAHNLQIFDYLKETIKKLDEVIHEINDISSQ